MARSPDPAVRVALIEASARLLATDGLAALSIRRVATEVGTSTMAVYTHFGGKDELVQEVVREAFDRLDAELRSVGRTDDPVTDLVRTGQAYRRNALANAHLYRVMFGLNPLGQTDPATMSGLEDDATRGLDAYQALVDAVARCVDAGAVDGDPRHLALQVWAMAHGVVSLELAGFLGDHGADTFDATARSLFLGLGR